MNKTLRTIAAFALLAGSLPARAEDEPKTPTLTWKDGKTTATFDKAEISLSNRIQIRFSDNDPQTVEGGPSFRLRRARTSLDGWLYRKELQYELMVDWVDSGNLVQDLAINWDVTGSKALQLKLGQFKVPFGRQELTSDTAQQFVDRSIVAAEFEKGRDQGLQVWGQVARKRLEYRAGVFNGNGRTRGVNDDGAFQYDARLMFQPWGDARYSEGDLESAGHPLLAVALNLERNSTRPASSPRGTPLQKVSVNGADVVFKLRGASLMAEAFRRTTRPPNGARLETTGYHVQAGCFVMPRVLELAVRLASIDPQAPAAGVNDRSEKGVAVNYLRQKHLLKVQADYRWLTDRVTQLSSSELRAQVQFVF